MKKNLKKFLNKKKIQKNLEFEMGKKSRKIQKIEYLTYRKL